MYALQIYDNQPIPYAATVIMEIWKNDDGEYEIEVSLEHDRKGRVPQSPAPRKAQAPIRCAGTRALGHRNEYNFGLWPRFGQKSEEEHIFWGSDFKNMSIITGLTRKFQIFLF
jgi:hypothetical protein